MRNKNKWIYDFNDLDPDYQLEIAEAIAKELKNNEEFLDDDEYDKQKSKAVRDFVEKLTSYLNQNKKLKKYKNLLVKFETLLEKNKSQAIDKLYEVIQNYINVEEKNEKEELCQTAGHKFGRWKCIQYNDDDESYFKEYWEKTCSRCGFKKRVYYEPKSLINKRIKKEKEEKIKKLELELKNIKNE